MRRRPTSRRLRAGTGRREATSLNASGDEIDAIIGQLIDKNLDSGRRPEGKFADGPPSRGRAGKPLAAKREARGPVVPARGAGGGAEARGLAPDRGNAGAPGSPGRLDDDLVADFRPDQRLPERGVGGDTTNARDLNVHRLAVFSIDGDPRPD
jgi:hypothetical protein